MDKPFPCPECRKDATLPQGGVDDLPAAFFVNRMKEVHSMFEHVHGKIEATCEICSEDKAEAFCRQCAQFICAECVKQHKRMKKSFPGHKVVSLDELKEGGVKEVISQEPSFESCKVHKEPMKIYCFTCCSLVCRDCTIKDHLGHNYEFISVCAPEMKKKLKQHLNPLKEVNSNLSLAVKEIQTTMSEVQAQGQFVANHIVVSFDELHRIIEHHKEKLLVEASAEVRRKLERLSIQKKSLSTASAVVQSVIEYTEQCVEHSADDEIMCRHAEIQSRIDREIEDHHKERKSLEPVEEVDVGMEVSCVEDLKQLFQTKAKITRIPIDCITTGTGLKNAEVGQTANFTVETKLSNGQPTKQKSVIECHLKSLVSGVTTKCEVVPIKGHEYCVKYTPNTRGRHELRVIVNGEEIAGSPFSVFVSIHPTLLAKPLKIITADENLIGASDVALSPAGTVMVISHTILRTYDKDGKKSSIKLKGDFYGISIDDSSGCIYKAGDKIIKLSPDLEVQEVFSSAELTFQGITLSGDEIITSCRNDKAINFISVFTKDLKLVRQGDSYEQFYNIVGVSSDADNNLYICDEGSDCIHVLSSNGDFLHSFGHDMVDGPRAVCVSGQYVYITNFSSNCVAVFTTEGKYVSSFGQEGSGEGDFCGPQGLCVDKDGFLFVCDTYNDRIQVF